MGMGKLHGAGLGGEARRAFRPSRTRYESAEQTARPGGALALASLTRP